MRIFNAPGGDEGGILGFEISVEVFARFPLFTVMQVIGKIIAAERKDHDVRVIIGRLWRGIVEQGLIIDRRHTVFIVFAAIIIAHDTDAGKGLNAVIGFQGFGEQNRPGLRGIGGEPHSPLSTHQGRFSCIAISRHIGIADKFDAAVIGRSRETVFGLRHKKPKKAAGRVLAFTDFFETNNMVTRPIIIQPVFQSAIFHQIIITMIINTDPQAVFSIIKTQNDFRAIKGGFKIDGWPLIIITMATCRICVFKAVGAGNHMTHDTAHMKG